MNRTRFALAAIVIALFATAETATAAPSWHAAQAISSPNSSNSAPDLAMNARGGSAAVWVRKGNGVASVEATTRSAGSGWRTPAKLSADPPAGLPHVSLDGSGHAHAIWAADEGTKRPIWTSVSSGAAWSAPTQISDGGSGDEPTIAVNEHGDAIAAYTGFIGVGFAPKAVFHPAGGAWSSPATLSPGIAYTSVNASVAINNDGRAVVAWTSNGSIEAAFYVPGSGWTKTETITPGNQNQAGILPHAAIDDAGRATVVWRWSSVALPYTTIEASEGAPGSNWTLPVALEADAPAGAPDVAVSVGGAAVATWERYNGAHTVVEVARRPAPGAAWSKAVAVSDGQKNSSAPSVATDPHGNALVAWDQKVVIGHVAYASEWRAGGSGWLPQHAVAGPANGETGPQVAFDSAGDAVVAIARGSSINAADYDAAPVLSGVQAPASGAVGQKLSFSAVAGDLWSPVTIAWDFGDGAKGSGSPVTHAYGAAGNYTVTVTARDAVGNATSAKKVVHVAAPAKPPAKPPTGPGKSPGGTQPAPAPHPFAGLRLKRQTVVVRKRVARVKAKCPVATSGACAGTLRLLSGRRVLGRARFTIAAGKTVRIRVKVKRVVRVGRASARTHDALGATRVTSAKLKLRRH